MCCCWIWFCVCTGWAIWPTENAVCPKRRRKWFLFHVHDITTLHRGRCKSFCFTKGTVSEWCNHFSLRTHCVFRRPYGSAGADDKPNPTKTHWKKCKKEKSQTTPNHFSFGTHCNCTRRRLFLYWWRHMMTRLTIQQRVEGGKVVVVGLVVASGDTEGVYRTAKLYAKNVTLFA